MTSAHEKRQEIDNASSSSPSINTERFDTAIVHNNGNRVLPGVTCSVPVEAPGVVDLGPRENWLQELPETALGMDSTELPGTFKELDLLLQPPSFMEAESHNNGRENLLQSPEHPMSANEPDTNDRGHDYFDWQKWWTQPNTDPGESQQSLWQSPQYPGLQAPLPTHNVAGSSMPLLNFEPPTSFPFNPPEYELENPYPSHQAWLGNTQCLNGNHIPPFGYYEDPIPAQPPFSVNDLFSAPASDIGHVAPPNTPWGPFPQAPQIPYLNFPRWQAELNSGPYPGLGHSNALDHPPEADYRPEVNSQEDPSTIEARAKESRSRRSSVLGDSSVDQENSRNRYRGTKPTVERRDGGWRWKDPASHNWYPCTWHSDIRGKLLEKHRGVNRVDRETGATDHDKTSFLPAQRNWDGTSREQWGTIGHGILYLLEPPQPASYLPEAQWWFDDGKLVLDYQNHPVIDFPEIPHVLSSKFEAPYIIAIQRMNPNITRSDFLARWPVNEKTDKNGIVQRTPIASSSAVGERVRRYRNRCGISIWSHKDKDDMLLPFLMRKAESCGCPSNSTEGMIWTREDESALEVQKERRKRKEKCRGRGGNRRGAKKVTQTEDQEEG